MGQKLASPNTQLKPLEKTQEERYALGATVLLRGLKGIQVFRIFGSPAKDQPSTYQQCVCQLRQVQGIELHLHQREPGDYTALSPCHQPLLVCL